MPGRFLNTFKPVTKIMPEVKAPERRIGFTEKLVWTAIVLVVYFVMTEIPIYGATTSGTQDPYFYLRVLFASTRGSLMELGIQPIVTAGMIIQLLQGSGMIGVNQSNPDDRATLAGITKFFSILMTTFLAIAYIIGGAYGTGLSIQKSLVIFAQLFVAGMIVMLLDELLQKGWGLGSGISLFIAAGVSQKIIWDIFLPLSITADGKAWGAVIGYFQSLLGGENALTAFVYRSRVDEPTMLGLVATIIVLLVVVFFENLKVEIPLSYAKYRGFRSNYPIKFLYVSNIPVILVSSLFMDFYFLTQIVWSRFNIDNSNVWLNLVGTFNATNNEPVGGIAYYITSPQNFSQFLTAPARGLVYAGLLVGLCVLFSVIWVEVGGLGPNAVAEQLVDSGMQIPGFRRSVKPIQEVLERYIPTVTVLGAIVVGVIASFANFLGVFGSGMGILLTVGVLYQYYQIIAQEQLTEMYPMFRRIFGME
ncbi:MAG: protein transport protein subunit alpha [Thermoproteota archaeon]|nr:protein transport protein subunit alpha [Thermoproteota archaeon]